MIRHHEFFGILSESFVFIGGCLHGLGRDDEEDNIYRKSEVTGDDDIPSSFIVISFPLCNYFATRPSSEQLDT